MPLYSTKKSKKMNDNSMKIGAGNHYNYLDFVSCCVVSLSPKIHYNRIFHSESLINCSILLTKIQNSASNQIIFAFENVSTFLN